MRRYPLADLLAASGLTEAALSRRARLSGTTLKQARERGFTADAADRYAIRLGLHPFEVWPELADHWLEDAEVECATEGCTNRFVVNAARGGQNRRFCSSSCRSKDSMRRHRATERGRLANRRYRAEYRAWLRSRKAA